MLDRFKRWREERALRRVWPQVAVQTEDGRAELRPFGAPGTYDPRVTALIGTYWAVRNAIDDGEPVTDSMFDDLRQSLAAWAGTTDMSVAYQTWADYWIGVSSKTGDPQTVDDELRRVWAVLHSLEDHLYRRIMLGKAHDFVAMHHQRDLTLKDALKVELERPWALQMAMENLATAAWTVVVRDFGQMKAVQILDDVVGRSGDLNEIRLAASGIAKVLDLPAPTWFQMSGGALAEAQTNSAFGLWLATEGLAALTDLALSALSDHDEGKWQALLADLTQQAIDDLPRPAA